MSEEGARSYPQEVPCLLREAGLSLGRDRLTWGLYGSLSSVRNRKELGPQALRSRSFREDFLEKGYMD